MRRTAGIVSVGVGIVVGVGLVGGRGAAGQEPAVEPAPLPGDVATAIAEDGWYADGEAVGDREQLDQVAERLMSQGEPMGFALLAAEPAGSSTVFAEQVLDALPPQSGAAIRTVVVLSDADVGVVSDFWSDDAIDAALDETIDDLRADPTDGLEALADALSAGPSGFDDTSDDDTSESDPNTGLFVFGVLAVGGLAVASRYWTSSVDSDGDGDADGDDSGGSSWNRRRRSFYRSSSSGRRSSRSSSSRRSSSGGSRRGRGGRRL